MTAMHTDAWGLPVTTSSTRALERYDRGIRGLLGWEACAFDELEQARREDPGLALAHAGSAVCLFLEERFADARAAAEAARQAVSGQSARERSHVEAMALLVAGKPPDAERAMREHLATYPRDLAVLQRLYFIWFWQGRFPEMLDFVTAIAPHYDGAPFFGGLHAFALEQANRCDEAVRVAEAALVRDPRDAWGVHALAHALYEQAVFDTGITRLPPATHRCTGLNWFHNHLVWHLALMHFAKGEFERASAIGRGAFERTPSSIAGDLHDSISLLWRLQMVGQDVSDRWAPFVAIARDRLDRQGLLFHAAHLAMAFAGGGDWATAERQVTMLRERAPKDRTGLVGEVLVPLVEGLHGFAAGDWRRVIERIEPLRGRIIELGGSRAQRDVFHDTLLEACLRADDMDRAHRYLAERVARRPDPYWVSRPAA
jgi:tetratricopeptide (TPR) repeat protein